MTNVATLFQQSVASHQAGDYVTAANGYAQVLKQQPGHADAWHVAGLLAYQYGKPADALNQIEQAIQLNPGEPEYYSNAATILTGLKQYQSAIEAADRAILIDPNFHQGHVVKGGALVGLNRLTEAQRSFETALKCGGDKIAVSIELANLLQIQGRISEAIAKFESVLELDPDCAQAYIQLSKFIGTGQFKFSQTMLARLLNLTDSSNQFALNDKARLFGALAVHYQANNKFDKAFHHFSSANQLLQNVNRQSKGAFFDPELEKTLTDQMINSFSMATIKELSPCGEQTEAPVFVIGMPRSGTTLVHQLLSRHSQIAGLGELTLIGDLIAGQMMASKTNPDDTFFRIDKAALPSAAQHYLNETKEAMRISGQESALRTIDKMPGNYTNVGFIKAMFPSAKIIHCVRDPRDICLSCFFTLFEDPKLQSATSSLENVSQLFCNYAKLMAHWHTVFEEDIYRLDYRNLVNQPDHEIRSILAFLDVPFERCSASSKSSPNIRTASVAQARRPVYKSSLGKWRRYEKHLERLADQLGDAIRSYQVSQAKH